MEEKQLKKKTARSKEERLAEIDKKIQTHEANIKKLKEKREAILNPKRQKRVGMKAVLQIAKEQGMTPKEMAQKLGINL